MKNAWHTLLRFLSKKTGRAIPTWIGYEEQVVGAGHPTLIDVVNRPTQELWETYRVGHTEDGGHSIAPEDIGAATAAHTHVASEIMDMPPGGNATYCIEGDGLQHIASGIYNPKGSDLNSGVLSGVLIMTAYTAISESLIERRDLSDALLWSFGRSNNNTLSLEISDGTTTHTYSSSDTHFPDILWGIPQEVGFQLDRVNNQLTFFSNGECEAWQEGGAELPDYADEGNTILGKMAHIDMFWAAICSKLLRNPGVNTPYPLDGRLVLLPGPLSYYYVSDPDPTETTLADRIRSLDLTIGGTVKEFVR